MPATMRSKTPESVWTLAKLTAEQEQLLKEAEATLGDGVLLAFANDQVTRSQLTPSQIQRLQELENKLGIVLVAVEPVKASGKSHKPNP